MPARFPARIVSSFAGLVALAAVLGLWASGAHSAYVDLLTGWGIEPFDFPFLDLNGSLSAWDCARKGVDVILSNPCDVLNRGYNYSPFWMTIDWIPLGRSDRVGAGLLLGVAFLISLSALPPPLSPAESGLRVAATLSTMTVYAIERANPDLLIFLFVIAMLSLLRRSPAARALAYGVAFLAGAIKYYPFVLFGIMVRERVRLFVPLALASLVALLLFCQIYGAQILEGLPHIAGGSPFNDMFGLKNFPRGMFRVFQDVMGSPSNALLATLLVTGLLFAMIAWRMTRLCWSSDLSAALRRLDEPRRLALLAGAWLLAGCTLAGQNVGYRGIFLLLVLPGLFAIGRDAAAGPLAKAARLAAIGIVPLMWAEAIRHWVHIAGESSVRSIAPLFDLLAWSAREVGWWFLIAFLLSIVVGFIAESPLFSVFRGNATARHPV